MKFDPLFVLFGYKKGKEPNPVRCYCCLWRHQSSSGQEVRGKLLNSNADRNISFLLTSRGMPVFWCKCSFTSCSAEHLFTRQEVRGKVPNGAPISSKRNSALTFLQTQDKQGRGAVKGPASVYIQIPPIHI